MSRAAAAAIIALLAAGAVLADDDADRIRRAVAHTLATQLPNGLFRYDFDFLAGEPTGQDNIVRQAGTLFALGEYLVDTGDPAVVLPLRAGFDALSQRSLPIGTGTLQALLEQLGVFAIDSGRLTRALERNGLLYEPGGDGRVVSGDGSYAGAYAGATALALIAELEYLRATGDGRYRELREGWLRGLLSLRVPGGGIRESPITLRTGPYVDGETWLALALYHEAFPDDSAAVQALAELEDHVLDRYGQQPNRLFYHWGALASAARLPTGDPARLVEFAADQAAFILDAVPPADTRDRSSCSLVEGLASAIAVVGSRPGREELLARMRERVAVELAQNRALQIRPRQDRLELGAGGLLMAPTLSGYDGAFLAGRYRAFTRTDLTQHCISALLIARRHGLNGIESEIPRGGTPARSETAPSERLEDPTSNDGLPLGHPAVR